MLRFRGNIGWPLLVVTACLLAASLCVGQTPATTPSAATKAASPTKSKSSKKKTALPVVEVPETPPPPPTLEQQPPTAPQVTYRNGELTINSQNATLSQVLRSVQVQTGASLDLPAGAASERVVATLGPGKPKDVLATLLNGSKFNYVILGENNNSGGVQKVILMAKTSGGTTGNPVVATNNPNPNVPRTPQAIEPPEDEYTPPEPEPEPEQNQNQLVPGQASMPGGEQVTPEVINPAGRTPEQMLQELQRIQQQQQVMQQQLNPANQGQPQAFPGQPQTPQPRPE